MNTDEHGCFIDVADTLISGVWLPVSLENGGGFRPNDEKNRF